MSVPRVALASWVALLATVFGAACAAPSVGAPAGGKDDDSADVPSGDKGTGDKGAAGDSSGQDQIGQQTAGEPTISYFETLSFNTIFPTYLAPVIGSAVSHVFPNVKITNPSSEAKTVILRGSLKGYTKEEAVGTLVLGPNETKSGWFDVTLDFAALDSISAAVNAQFSLTLETQEGKILYAVVRPAKILPKNTVFWSGIFADKTTRVEDEAVTGLLTTPHDRDGLIDDLLHKAATFSAYKSMFGYDTCAGDTLDKARACTADQVGAIYKALQSMGFNYTSVGDDFFKDSQNIRYPAESLKAKTGNCIDGALVFASALEAIGMRPAVVYKTGHAFLMVKYGPAGSAFADKAFAVETTMVGNTSKTFEDAVNSAMATYQKASSGSDSRFHVVELDKVRAKGFSPSVFPM